MEQPSATPSRHILVTRSAAECARWGGMLQQLGSPVSYYAPFVTKVLRPNADDTAMLLQAGGDRDTGLIITSARAIEALQSAAPQIIHALRQRPVFTVGAATAAAAAAAGFAHVDAAAGDAAGLASRLSLVAKQLGLTRLWHLSGEALATDLAPLMPEGITLSRVVIYAAQLPPVPPEITTALQAGFVTDIVLLSARVAQHLLPHLQGVVPHLHCLSPRIAAVASRACPRAHIVVAPQPDMNALIRGLFVPQPQPGQLNALT